MLANKSITAYSMITSTLTEWYGDGAVPSKWELPNPKLE